MGLLLWVMVLSVMLYTLFVVSSVARYYLKFAVFIIVSGVCATVPMPLMLLRPRDCRNALIPAAGLRLCSRLYGITTKVVGTENIVKDSGCVVLINHQSILDLLVLAELWPVMDNCTVISKKEILYMFPFGFASWLWGTIFIDRLNPEQAQESINKTGTTIRNRKARVLMFPEGTRNMRGKLLPFRKGAFHLAVASQCPIQPVIVSPYTFLGKGRFEAGHVTISILPPIETKGMTKDSVTELTADTHETMSKYFSNKYGSENGLANPNNNISKKSD